MGHPEPVEGRAQWPTPQCFDRLSRTPTLLIELKSLNPKNPLNPGYLLNPTILCTIEGS
jgi:hypothetical protein